MGSIPAGVQFMSQRRMTTTVCLTIIALVSCANGRAADPLPANQQSIINAAKENAALHLAVQTDAIEVVSALRVTWPDGSLGCPEPDMQYTQALVPGWRIFLRANGRTLDYHAAANGHVILCPPERAIEPILGDPT
jgi:hypothetical protein